MLGAATLVEAQAFSLRRTRLLRPVVCRSFEFISIIYQFVVILVLGKTYTVLQPWWGSGVGPRMGGSIQVLFISGCEEEIQINHTGLFGLAVAHPSVLSRKVLLWSCTKGKCSGIRTLLQVGPSPEN